VIKDLLWKSSDDFKDQVTKLIQNDVIDIDQIKPKLMLNTLLQGNLEKFEKEFPKLIMNVLSFHDVQNNLVESNYHLFIVGLFSQAQFCGYKIMSNKESGLGRFDLKNEPTEHANYSTSVIMEFKIIKNKNNDDDEYDSIDDYEETGPNEDEVEYMLKKKAKEGLEQISKKKYDSDITSRSTKLVECGIAFQGKRTCVLGKVFCKEGDHWIESHADHMNI